MRRRRYCWCLVPAVSAALAGCSGDTPSRIERCEALHGRETTAALPAGRLSTSTVSSEKADCTWTAGPSRLDVTIRQRVAKGRGVGRADDDLARQWRKDDEQNVTVAVPGVGRSAYRFTNVVEDVVTVTVRAYLGYREVTVALSVPYPRRGGLAGLESAAVAVATKAVTAT